MTVNALVIPFLKSKINSNYIQSLYKSNIQNLLSYKHLMKIKNFEFYVNI